MTRSAAVAAPLSRDDPRTTVSTTSRLEQAGWSRSAVRAQLAARRWQRCGRAIVRHNSVLSFAEQARVGLLNCGPRAALTAFTAAELGGLKGWHRDAVHVLVPAGARVCRPPGFSMRVHWIGDWRGTRTSARGDAMCMAFSAVAAPASFDSPRPACGILAAAVQQRLVRVEHLRDAVERHERLRNHHLFTRVLDDIEGGAQALSEIDFTVLCRRHGLPTPARQAVRVDPSGRRRYLDAEWRLPDGRVIVAEVDGALHMIYRRWWDDSLRQNELVIAGQSVLRFPSALLRCDAPTVVDQVSRALA